MSNRRREDSLLDCSKKCIELNHGCHIKDCKHWRSYEEECNCSLVSIYINGNMSLHQIGERLDLSFVRISQIEKKALKRLKLVCKT